MEKVSIKFCTVCKSVHYGGLWIESSKSPEDYVEMILKTKIKLPENVQLLDVVVDKMGPRADFEVKLKIKGTRTTQIYKTQINKTQKHK